mgnify:CR=1 FL=1
MITISLWSEDLFFSMISASSSLCATMMAAAHVCFVFNKELIMCAYTYKLQPCPSSAYAPSMIKSTWSPYRPGCALRWRWKPMFASSPSIISCVHKYTLQRCPDSSYSPPTRVLLPDTPISQSALNLPSNGCLPRVCLLHSMTKRLTAWYRGFPTIMEHVRSKHVRGTWKENQPWVASVYSNSFWLVLSLPVIFAWAAWCDTLYMKLRTRLIWFGFAAWDLIMRVLDMFGPHIHIQ